MAASSSLGSSTPGDTTDSAVPALVVERHDGREGFLKLRTAWNKALVTGPDPSPALEHDLLRLWIESFAPSAPLVTILVEQGDGVACGAALLLEETRLDGVPVRVLRTPTNAHSTRGGLLLGDTGTAAIARFIDAVAQQDWDVLELPDLPQDGALVETLASALERAGMRLKKCAPMQSPYIALPASMNELERRLDAHFRQNLRRRRRRLSELGEVTFESHRGVDGLDEALEAAFEIEAAGWKGRAGTAIRDRPETVAFYAGWARLLAREGRLRLNFLKVGGKRIAFHFAHVTRGRYLLPKCGFLESHREFSPGQLLMSEVLSQSIEESLETFEFLGHTMTWKRDWTPLVRHHISLRAFRRTLRGDAAFLVNGLLRPMASRLRRRVTRGSA